MKLIKKITVLTLLITGMMVAGPSSPQAAKVPDFSLSAINGKSQTIDIKKYRGKVVLVVFWATWCQPCMEEVPSLIRLQKEYGARGFSVIGLSVDESGTSTVLRVVKRVGINYPVALASAKIRRGFGGILGIPNAFMIDRSGNIVEHYSGWTSHKVIASDLQKVLKRM
ncbi:MAG: TlpA family protein disulfide reductase [Deltaproteobacteria bacterium]|nr:TlpA family protein disulfide reductase [Deltaproteobacteria bacterium]